jgi:hypothetical protein
MNLEQTNVMLALFSEYWPAFDCNETRVKAWAGALVDYDRAEAWEAVKEFRVEEDRTFAPTISELIGRMDYRRERREIEQTQKYLLDAPATPNDFEPMETYTYSTTRTTPKRKKDESDFEVRKAVRQTREARKIYDEKMRKMGFKQRFYDLANGRKGSIWVKA